MLSVRCRAYSGLESGKLENKSEEHELGDDDDVVDNNSKSTFVRNHAISVVLVSGEMSAINQSMMMMTSFKKLLINNNTIAYQSKADTREHYFPFLLFFALPLGLPPEVCTPWSAILGLSPKIKVNMDLYSTSS